MKGFPFVEIESIDEANCLFRETARVIFPVFVILYVTFITLCSKNSMIEVYVKCVKPLILSSSNNRLSLSISMSGIDKSLVAPSVMDSTSLKHFQRRENCTVV